MPQKLKVTVSEPKTPAVFPTVKIKGVTSISRNGSGQIVILVLDGGQCLTDPAEIQKYVEENTED